jgi:hypothetical protein
MNKMLLATAVTGLVAASLPSHAQQATITDQFVGTWKVVTLKEISGDEVSYPLGQQVAGYVTITPYRLWLLIVDSTRKAPTAAALTDAEASEMMKSHVAWTGKYLTANDTGQGIAFTAHIDTASSQAITGADRVFFIRVVKIRFWLPGRFVLAGVRGASKKCWPLWGTEGSNPLPSSVGVRDEPVRSLSGGSVSTRALASSLGMVVERTHSSTFRLSHKPHRTPIRRGSSFCIP